MDFNQLPAHVWPRNAKRRDDGVVAIAGLPLTELAAYALTWLPSMRPR